MNRIRNIFCLILIAFCGFIVGCSSEKVEKDIKTVDYLNIEWDIEDSLYVGDIFKPTDNLKISTNLTNPQIQFGSENEEIIKITDNGFLCLSEGETRVFARARLSEGRYVYASEKIIVESVPSFYTSFSLQSSVVKVDYKNRENIKNVVSCTGESTYPVVVEYSSDILTYDYTTGLLDIKKVGECKVTLKVPAYRDDNRELQYTTYAFDVYVDKVITNVTLTGYSGGLVLKKGEVGQLLLNVSPTTYTVEDPKITCDSDIISFEGTTYTAKEVGECNITITYQNGVSTFDSKTYKVKIYDQPENLILGLYHDDVIVDGDLEVGKEYKLIISADCVLGDFSSLLINNVDPNQISEITISQAKLVEGKIEYKVTINAEMDISFLVGYYKSTYSSEITCIDAILNKTVVDN